MAIWSVHNRVDTVILRFTCEECYGNGYFPPSEEDQRTMVCGANICSACKGSGYSKPNDEVLDSIKEALANGKEKKKAKKTEKPEPKPFMLVINYTARYFRYIMATSKEEANRMWEDGSFEDVEYDFDECGRDEKLEKIEELE